jgi:DNA-binding response OmpR family regulator
MGAPIMPAPTILIVDDEAYVTAMVGQGLRKLGFTVIVGSDGEEAYRMACQEMPRLMVTDYQMPILSGYECAVRLKENPQTAAIPVLMLTARGHHISASDLLRTNIVTLFPKPFSLKELLKKVEELVSVSGDPVASSSGAATLP